MKKLRIMIMMGIIVFAVSSCSFNGENEVVPELKQQSEENVTQGNGGEEPPPPGG
ncbi:MAG: hypothetical protein AAF363_15565 [Bacteroidota bacterium]